MKKYYVIVRLNDNHYWGFGYWQKDIKEAQYFETPQLPTRRISEGDLYEKGSEGLPIEGTVFELKEVWVKEK